MKRAAFTLIELLVVMVIVAILAALAYTVSGKMMEQGYLARELTAGRSLIAGYLAYAGENNNELMTGYATGSGDIKDDLGHEIQYPASGRYPWRLASYLKASPRGTLIVNQQAKLTEKNRAHAYYVYIVSLLPTFGMNSTLVGGDQTGSLSPTPGNISRLGNYCLTNLAQAVKPSWQIVFCSAHYQNEPGEGQFGYHSVSPPSLTGRKWPRIYDPKLTADRYGYVHFRYNDKAAAVMLDGHAELFDFEQLQDMRRWSNQAAEEDEPNFLIHRQQ